MPPGDDGKRRQALFFANAYSLAIFFPVAIGVGVGLGWWLDKLFHTRPWLMAVFGAFGVIAAFIQLFRVGTSDDGSSGQQ